MKVKFDLMCDERFVKSFVYDTKNSFPPTEKELHDYVIEKLPTLKNKDFTIEFYGRAEDEI